MDMTPSESDSPSAGRCRLLFDVCFSFASEDREYVDSVFGFLKSRGIRVFYDKDFQVEMWGKNLHDYLSDLYKNKDRDNHWNRNVR